MRYKFILIGSTHFYLDDFVKQKEIIDKFNPEYVLSEELEDIKLETKAQFEEILKRKYISEMTSFKEVEAIIKLCYEKGIKLIGIDIHNFGFDKKLIPKIKSQSKLTKNEEKTVEKIVKEREQYHLEKIKEYEKKTTKTIVVIVGSWHLRKGSLLRTKLNNYKIVAPRGKDGEVLTGPEQI